MKINFIGHAAFYFEADKVKALIDPFITGNPAANITVDDLKDITHIFITHGHGDHLGDCVNIAKKHNALVITNHEIAAYLGKQGVKTHSMHIGGRYKFDFGVVKLTHAVHGSGIHTDNGVINGGSPAGFLITINNKTLYHAGDTGLTMDMKLLDIENIDLALLPIGGNYTMDIKDCIRAVELINPKAVIPMHYNTFDLVKADPELFKASVTNSKVIILKPGESLEI